MSKLSFFLSLYSFSYASRRNRKRRKKKYNYSFSPRLRDSPFPFHFSSRWHVGRYRLKVQGVAFFLFSSSLPVYQELWLYVIEVHLLLPQPRFYDINRERRAYIRVIRLRQPWKVKKEKKSIFAISTYRHTIRFAYYNVWYVSVIRTLK